MKIAIIVAMTKELNLLLPLINSCKEVSSANGFSYYEGLMAGKEVAVMQCGIGKVNAAVGAFALIEAFHPDIVINSGVAGGTGSEAKILDVVVGDRVAYHDVWCGPCAERGRIQGMPMYFEAPAEVLAKIDESGHVKKGLIASGDQFVDNAGELVRIKTLYHDVLAVDMESAAIAQVCHIKGVPFTSIRVVSDTPGEADNTSQYQHFWDDAPLQTFHVLTQLIEAL